MNSLQQRLSLGLVFSLLVLLLAQWWFSSQAIETLLTRQVQDQLQQDSELLVAGIEFNPQGALALNTQRVPPAYQQPYSGAYYAVQHMAQTRYSRSVWDAQLSLPTPAGGEAILQKQVGPDGQQLLVYARTYLKDRQPFTVVVAKDISGLLLNITRYKHTNAVFSVLFLLALVLIQQWIVRRTLKPLAAARAALVKLQQGDITSLEFNGPEEIKPLVDELNRLLLAVDLRLKRSREGMGNLAHALKTRLARLAQLSTESDPSLFSAEVQALTLEVARLIDRETARIRVVGNLRPGQKIPLQSIVNSLVQGCSQIHRHKNLHFNVEVPTSIHVLGDREDLFELFGNLIDNASKWAASTVSIRLDQHTLTVQDDGPGCPESVLDTLTQRGFRADETTPGSGLGLAIAQDIAQSYGASLAFRNVQPGLQVAVTFKPASLV